MVRFPFPNIYEALYQSLQYTVAGRIRVCIDLSAWVAYTIASGVTDHILAVAPVEPVPDQGIPAT